MRKCSKIVIAPKKLLEFNFFMIVLIKKLIRMNYGL